MWWSTQLHMWNSRDVSPQVPDMTINTDASLTGWEAVCDRVCTEGLWSPKERRLHINHLELLASSFAVQSFTKDKRNICIHLQMDNNTAHFYVSRMGGLSLSLMGQACCLWHQCLQRGITLSAEHLPGLNNQSTSR